MLCRKTLEFRNTVVGETLAVLTLPQIRKNCQCLDGQVGKTFLEIFGGNYNFLKFREAMNALILNVHMCLTSKWLYLDRLQLMNLIVYES